MSTSVVLTSKLHLDMVQKLTEAKPCPDCLADPLLVMDKDSAQTKARHYIGCAALARESEEHARRIEALFNFAGEQAWPVTS